MDFGITDTATEYGVSDTLTPCFVFWLARLSKQVANTLMTYGKENPGGGMQKTVCQRNKGYCCYLHEVICYGV